jgi:putative oxidoreductase
MLQKFFTVPRQTFLASLGLLALRLAVGAAFMLHGFGKIQNPMGWMGPDSPTPGALQALAALSEFGGGLAWILGLLTPLASLGILSTMAVALHMHVIIKGDPFVAHGGSSFELALVYFSVAVVMLLVGPGRLAADSLIFGERR